MLTGTLRFLLLCLFLTGCSLGTITPKPPPPPAEHAQEVVRAQTLSLEKMGTISVQAFGSPDDAMRRVQERADYVGARYYYIIMVSETIIPGSWYSQAILYR